MKKLVLSLSAFLFSFAMAFAQIPEGGFDNLTSEGGCSQPVGWSTVNGTTGGLGLCTAEAETSNPYSGAAALKIETGSIFFQTVPGLVSNGTINIQSQSVSGGVPFTERPTAFTGWYRAEPENGDSYSMIAVLINENTGDSVGVAIFEGTATVTDWTQFTEPVQYLNQQTPTLLQITMFASDPLDPQDGSTVYFDELDYESITVDIEERDLANINVYPNPATDMVFFNIGKVENAVVEVYNMLGLKVLESSVSEMNNQLNVSTLSAGTYIWEMSSTTGQQLKVGKLLIAR